MVGILESHHIITIHFIGQLSSPFPREGARRTMIPPTSSLVKYNNPVLVSTTTGGNKGGKKKTQAPPVDRQQTAQTEDILNSILPPRCVIVYIKAYNCAIRP